MVEVVEIDPSQGDRIYLATGGEGMKLLPQQFRKSEIYYGDDPDREWQRVPIKFPSIFTLTPL